MDGTPPMQGSAPIEGSPTPPMDAPATPPMDGSQRILLEKSNEQPSLSSRGTTTTAVAVPTQRTEREIEGASQKSDKPEDPITSYLIGAGCPEDLTEDVRNHFAGKGVGWFAVLAKNGHLPFHVMDALESLDRQQAPQGMSNTEYRASLSGHPPCPHHEPGGNVPRDSDGWMYCANCRVTAGWVSKNQQPRTEERVIRSPADQRVADGQKLYDKYKALELRKQHIPYRDHPPEAYRNSKI